MFLRLYAKADGKKYTYKGMVNLKRASVITRSQRFSSAVKPKDTPEVSSPMIPKSK